MPPDDYTLTPVDHDPYTHTPVDYDPFAAEKFLPPVLADASKAAAQGDYQALTAGRTPDNSPVLYPTADPRFGITQQDIDNGIGVGLATSGGGLSTKGIRAYHGSPHDFDAFSMDKIGTGEGAQAYGHGLYFAESEPVAKSYRDALSGQLNDPAARTLIDGKPLAEHPDFAALSPTAQNRVKGAFSFSADKKSALNTLDYQLENGSGLNALQRPDIESARKFIEDLPENMGRRERDPGKMYQVDINADPEHFLDWDKPLAADHPLLDLVRQKSQAILDKPGGFGSTRNEAKDAIIASQSGNMTGEGAYKALARGQSKLGNLPNPGAATQALREAGIPGIKYLDQGSRAAGNGSRNYVVFDDKMVNIVKKYGLAGLSMLPPAIAAEYSKRLTPVDHDPFAGT